MNQKTYKYHSENLLDIPLLYAKALEQFKDEWEEESSDTLYDARIVLDCVEYCDNYRDGKHYVVRFIVTKGTK